MMWNLGYFLGLSNMHEDDMDVENRLATLDPSCYPPSWIDHVKMDVGSDTQYNFLVKVLNVCERQTCEVFCEQKGSEVFSGVKGIAIFFHGLTGHAFEHYPLEEYRHAFYRVYKAVNIIFPISYQASGMHHRVHQL